MARIARKWAWKLCVALCAAAFAAAAFEFIDAAAEPPSVVSLSGNVTGCVRVDGGLLLSVAGGEDLILDVAGGGEAPLGYRILGGDGAALCEGEGTLVPLSDWPDAAGVFVFALDGTPIEPDDADGAAASASVPSAVRRAAPVAYASAAGAAGSAAKGISGLRSAGHSGLQGMFTIEIVISEPFGGVDIMGVGAPGGTITSGSLPEFSFGGPGHSNVCSVSAWGGSFVPPETGTYSFQVAGDNEVSLTVGNVKATASWPDNTPGGVKSGYFVKGVSYPVEMSASSDGGPAAASVLKFAEFTPAPTNTPVYDAHMEIDYLNAQCSLKADVGAKATATIVGARAPNVTYKLRCVRHDPCISVSPEESDSAIEATPLASGTWDENTATATFAFVTNNVEAARETVVFTLMPEKPPQKPCCVCGEKTTVSNGCVEFMQDFGRTPWIAGLPVGRLAIRETSPSARLWTPGAFVYDHPMCRRMVTRRDAHPLDVVIIDAYGQGTEYRDGRPYGMSAGLQSGVRYNSAGLLVEVLEDRTEITYRPDGTVASIAPPDGDPVTVEDLGIDILRDGVSGAITSVVSRADGRIDVETLSSTSYLATWRGPSGAVAKSFTFSGDGTATFHLHEYRSEAFQFDTEWEYDASVNDWTFTKAPGTPAAKTSRKAISYDEDAGAWNATYTTLDATGAVVRTESSVLDVSGKSIMETSRTVGGRSLYSAERNAAGTVSADVNGTGLATAYLYDGWNRVTNETSTVKGGIVRRVTREYTDQGASGGVVDRRPRRRTVAENGVVVEDEETIYASNRVTRIRRSGNVERTSFRDLDAQGRTVLSVDEAGRAVRRQYSAFDETDFSWTETRDEGLWTDDGGFATLDGRSTRRVTSFDASGNAVAIRDYALVEDEWRELSWTTNRYNAAHKVVATIRSDGKSSSADWICTGPVWTLDEDGIATTNAYDAAKALVSSVRYGPHGAVATAYGYDADGRIVSETDSAGGCVTRTRLRSYDEEGRIVSETDEHGLSTAYAYSSDGRTTTVTLPSGATRTTTINPDGSLASVTGTAVTPEYWTYGVTPDGLTWTKVTYLAPDGARWAKTFRNGFGEIVREERPGANGSVLSTDFTYNAKGQNVVVTATGEPAEVRIYDEWGDVAVVTRAADGASRSQAGGTLNAIVDGEVWSVEAAAAYCSDQTIAPIVTTNMTQLSGLSLSNESRRVSIDARGNAVETWTAFDPATSARRTFEAVPYASNIAFSETVDGVTVLSVSHSAVTNSVACDAYRRAVVQTDGRGNATTNAYDSLGRLASVTDATGATTSYAYDSAGRLAAVTNALGVATVYEYDVRGNKTYEGGGTYPVSYAYDAFNVMTNMTTYRAEVSQSGDTTSWTYDDATGLLLAKTYADGHGPTYTYTDNGNLATRTWARGVVTSYLYDGWNNLTNTAYSDGTRPMSFAYDALGRQIYAKDEGGITTVAYDEAGDVASEHTTGRLYTRTLARHRDTFGRDTGYSLNNSRKTVVEYESATGRIRRMQNAGAWFTFYYLPGTDLKSRLQYGGSGSAYYSYEPHRDLLTQVRNYINGGVISQYDYVNDAIGRRTEISRSGSMMSETRTDAYGYNDRNELISAGRVALVATGRGTLVVPDALVASAHEYEYSYDDIGNRLSSLDLGTNRTYVANNLNQYTQISNICDSASLCEQFIPQYDLDGNQTLIQTSTGVWTVTYNAENRPVLWTCGDKTIEMLFDRMGRRVEYIETSQTSQTITNAHHRFVYDGYLCVQRLDALSSNLIELSFAWDPTEPVATRPLVMQRNGGWNFFYTHDGNKNVSDVVSFQQARGVPAHYEYAPFGEVTVSATNTAFTAFNVATTNPYRFSSEYADDALGLVYYNYRHYNFKEGRWLSRDRIVMHGYVFCGNNSVVKVDGLGLFDVWEHITSYFDDWYGNYGGAKRINGTIYPEGQKGLTRSDIGPGQDNNNPYPIDCFDECYQEHDRCIADANNLSKTPPSCCEGAKNNCDFALSACLAKCLACPYGIDAKTGDPGFSLSATTKGWGKGAMAFLIMPFFAHPQGLLQQGVLEPDMREPLPPSGIKLLSF